MFNITKMLTEFNTYGDQLRYDKDCSQSSIGTRPGLGPVVAWNINSQCNLNCKHCYSNSTAAKKVETLNTKEAFALIDQLADFKVPVLLLSGGEPLLRPDLFKLIKKAKSRDLRVVLSTNGTLLTEKMVQELKSLGVSYIGISLDGMKTVNDQFRGKKGAFNAALEGIQNCQKYDQKVGLRFTINQENYQQVDELFQLIEKENIPRICFYHLVYSGRGENIKEAELSDQDKKMTIDKIINWTQYFIDQGEPREILTVDNHADGAYLYLKTKKNEPEQAEYIYSQLLKSGGNRSGSAIANIDHQGDVFADQFSRFIRLGNIRENSFSEIWQDQNNEFLNKMRNRKKHLKGRCAACRFLEICNGNLRARAYAAGDLWGADPGCYLSDQEIGGVYR
ncbi:radical SAM protein with 4Fe4S-binding SPASM domain [Halanaerobium saccharolyticum]|uniref:Mycofactocin maturase MftC n=1 Tax=Halanaerobium saccharolyticum TaxID=43595 RepID=A0A4R7YSU4_9FIRM|nr:radical SAM protein [Halanaerobium saccharolyticum]RAK05180.1 radical SAM protein with 4Fe4S-binding SPASM domain [Halanaerobium saccharolyticum]TDV99011.1 radical SAM protein with 4Fe4S-binding SPASM domain [Halanaerobium saccharolyticum]TDX51702.1 radical SAM protein with 4Fe4S-binding SPASM domain [Halanaerobium saccharolyticum]